MIKQRKIEIFSASCPACKEVIDLVNRIICSSCDINILDMNQADIADRAKDLGIKTVPAVVIDGQLADCCSNNGPDEKILREHGLGNILKGLPT